ncbi:Dyp-type peroxidase [Undibacterium rugosum]|uniref:Dyp-type peroxidase n=1 Tax=Undibacterium rugosum TaxID=2762291 RepID=UPI001B8185B9|nr:Dyp-type peroxidase [Undibacterium rugosum]MBR7777697.1 Dyp-type peroxidase [Undibacterium rugosum]
MSVHQTAILDALPAHATYLSFDLQEETDASAVKAALKQIQRLVDGQRIVMGVGMALAQALKVDIPGLLEFSGIANSKVALPATPAALWLWLRESERGELLHQQQRVVQALGPIFQLQQEISAFKYGSGRDLTGYEDGTENPQNEEAVRVAIAADGSSYVAVQQWEHQFARFHAYTGTEQDQMIGRRRSDNEELEEAPVSAHVKRTAQEDFAPEAFVMRRSMPWTEGARGGLYFVAFATSFAPFEAQLTRMCGAEDGVTDDLFHFSQPLTTAYFWCPPLQNGHLSLAWCE